MHLWSLFDSKLGYLLKVTKDNHLPVFKVKTRSFACINNDDHDVLGHVPFANTIHFNSN